MTRRSPHTSTPMTQLHGITNTYLYSLQQKHRLKLSGMNCFGQLVQGGSRTPSNHVVKSLISGFFPLNLPQNTLPPIIIVQWKMGVSPIFVSLGSFPLNHDYGRKGSLNTQNNFSSGELFIMIQVHPSDTGRDGNAPRMTPGFGMLAKVRQAPFSTR